MDETRRRKNPRTIQGNDTPDKGRVVQSLFGPSPEDNEQSSKELVEPAVDEASDVVDPGQVDPVGDPIIGSSYRRIDRWDADEVLAPWFCECPGEMIDWIRKALDASAQLSTPHLAEPPSLIYCPWTFGEGETGGLLIAVEEEEDGTLIWARRGAVAVKVGFGEHLGVVEVTEFVADELVIPLNEDEAEELMLAILDRHQRNWRDFFEPSILVRTLASLEAGKVSLWHLDVAAQILTNEPGAKVLYFRTLDPKERAKTLFTVLHNQSARSQELSGTNRSAGKASATLPERSEILVRFDTLDAQRKAEATRKVEAMYTFDAEKGKERLEWLTRLPVPKDSTTRPTRDGLARQVAEVRSQLNRMHPGTPELVERFVECFVNEGARSVPMGSTPLLVGAPGVGKTRFVKDYANALGREFRRIDLGGMNDPSELLGFSSTYLHSRPGRLISTLAGCETPNPIILLDEIDKTGQHRGTVQDVFLALLDPENHGVLVDAYLEVPYDFSGVSWVATANSAERIGKALLDRLEVIEVPGYSDEEKFQIVRTVLLPEMKEAYEPYYRGIIDLTNEVIERLVALNVGEPGLRTLRQWVQSLVSKLLVADLEGDRLVVGAENVAALLGLDDRADASEARGIGSYL